MEEYEKYFASLHGKRVGVIGLGVSNLPLIGLLVTHGARITVYDKKDINKLGQAAKDMQSNGVSFVCGESYADNIDDDIVFRTPGVLPTNPGLVRARENGAQITSEMELFFELCPSRIIGITGSDGKTTTATIISELLKRAGYCVFLGGNIGRPLLSEIPHMKNNDFVVVELSSFQLMDMKLSPHTAVITNISPNHLDKHRDMQEYINAKKNIFAFQTKENKTVANYDNDITAGFLKETKAAPLAFSKKYLPGNGVYLASGMIILSRNGKSEKILDAGDIKIPGMHNVENYMAAIGAVCEYVSAQDIQKVAASFAGVPHRLEFVRELDGVKYYNSSIDSSPTRTVAALSVFGQKVILIAGGSDKNISFDNLGDTLAGKAKIVILTGHTSEKLARSIIRSPQYRRGAPLIIKEKTLQIAVKTAHSLAVPSDIVLLSPACASFDAFNNFEERGEVFKKSVLEL